MQQEARPPPSLQRSRRTKVKLLGVRTGAVCRNLQETGGVDEGGRGQAHPRQLWTEEFTPDKKAVKGNNLP